LKTEYSISERRACQAMQMNRSSYRYVGGQDVMDDAYQRVVSLSDQYRYWGYRKIVDLMKGKGESISRERERLIRRREGLQAVKKRRKRKLLGMTTQWVNQAHYPNHVWSYDFVFDRTEDARQFRGRSTVEVHDRG
jgi:hypothetical protein